MHPVDDETAQMLAEIALNSWATGDGLAITVYESQGGGFSPGVGQAYPESLLEYEEIIDTLVNDELEQIVARAIKQIVNEEAAQRAAMDSLAPIDLVESGKAVYGSKTTEGRRHEAKGPAEHLSELSL